MQVGYGGTQQQFTVRFGLEALSTEEKLRLVEDVLREIYLSPQPLKPEVQLRLVHFLQHTVRELTD